VQACLDAAASELNAAELGTSYDEIHGLLAAHKIALGPYGTAARMITITDRLGNVETKTAYEVELDRAIARRVLPLGVS
jgi:hypothetical protein